MQISLEKLRKLIKETMTETYFGASPIGSLASTALNDVGNVPGGTSIELPPDPVEIANQIRALIGGDAGFPVGEWGDEALNAAASAAADALINAEQRDKTRRSPSLGGTGPMGEQKRLVKEALNIIKEVQAQKIIDPAALSTAINKVINILDSMNMSLNLIYGAVSGHEGPISGISGRKKYFGRAMTTSHPSAPGKSKP